MMKFLESRSSNRNFTLGNSERKQQILVYDIRTTLNRPVGKVAEVSCRVSSNELSRLNIAWKVAYRVGALRSIFSIWS